ncbi:transporter substrate-binding domain-containing protein, partial [Streptomyces diastatochromogenes]|uniref:transporter substrate-binding domain-containing protein n=1 Tax=Streptomyces diastatochromogenes TaxID=42236 RepID=UPI0036C4C742
MTASSTRRTTAAHSRLAAVGAIAVAGALLLTGCGDQTKDKNNGSGSASTSNAPLADKLPKEIRDKGEIKVGSDIAYAPVEFKDSSGNVVGLDPDLAAAMGKQLGVKLSFENGTFDALLTGLRSGREHQPQCANNDNKKTHEGVDPDTPHNGRAGRAKVENTKPRVA